MEGNDGFLEIVLPLFFKRVDMPAGGIVFYPVNRWFAVSPYSCIRIFNLFSPFAIYITTTAKNKDQSTP